MAKKATILIVDREQILVDLLTRALSSAELSVLGTIHVGEAARLVELYGADIVMINPAIPDGMTLITQLQVAPVRPKIVALTESDEMRDSVRTIGVDTIVDRSSGLDKLAEAIRAALPDNLSVLASESAIRVLIVDDDEEICQVLSEFLKRNGGYLVSAAKNGREALAQLRDDASIQVVLLDLSMPVMGGMEVLNEIVNRQPHPNVIMMTAVADREIARQAIKIGAFDYILKPFDFSAITDSILASLTRDQYKKQPWWKRLAGR